MKNPQFSTATYGDPNTEYSGTPKGWTDPNFQTTRPDVYTPLIPALEFFPTKGALAGLLFFVLFIVGVIAAAAILLVLPLIGTWHKANGNIVYTTRNVSLSGDNPYTTGLPDGAYNLTQINFKNDGDDDWTNVARISAHTISHGGFMYEGDGALELLTSSNGTLHTVLFADDVQRVGINTTHPAQTLHVAGNVTSDGCYMLSADELACITSPGTITLGGNTAPTLVVQAQTTKLTLSSTGSAFVGPVFSDTGFFVVSDKRVKRVGASCDRKVAYNNIRNLEVKEYFMKDQSTGNFSRRKVGFLAQEVQKVIPDAVHSLSSYKHGGDNYTDFLTVDNGRLVAELWAAVSHLADEVERLSGELKKCVRRGEFLQATSALQTQLQQQQSSQVPAQVQSQQQT